MDAPESLQDLGTFVQWLIERLGYEVRLQIVKHEGTERRKVTGQLQRGVDLVATRRREDGSIGLYRFVLKHGDVNIAVWGRSSERGNIVHDLNLAASSTLKRDQEELFLHETRPTHLSVVAVHNGDFHSNAAASRDGLRDHLATCGVALEWWSAQELAEKAASTLGIDDTGTITSKEALFPPAVRPFVRLALDSVRRDSTRFDLRAVDEYLDARLPLGRELEKKGAVERLTPGEVPSGTALVRQISELPIFISMLLAECHKQAYPTVLPVLDALERCICRVVEMARRLPDNDVAMAQIIATVVLMMGQYGSVADGFRARLDSIQGLDHSLALASLSEAVDYPLRCTRFLSYLAVTGHLLLEIGRTNEAAAFAMSIAQLWVDNAAGCEGPVTDDQIIELSIIWQFWLRLGMHQQLATVAGNIVERMAMARVLGLALPALYQQAAIPMSEQDARVLARAHTLGPTKTPGFEQGGSTLLSFALYVARRLGQVDPETVKRLHERSREPGSRPTEPCYLQLWQPPEDAADEWYAHEIAYRGVCWVFEDVDDREAFLGQFEKHARPPQPSFGQRIGLPVLDLIAWKRWRTLPDASRLVVLCQQTVQQSPEEKTDVESPTKKTEGSTGSASPQVDSTQAEVTDSAAGGDGAEFAR